jgi:hypothetical protein
LSGGCGVFVGDEPDPVGLKVGGELVFKLLLKIDCFIGFPIAVPGDVDFDGYFGGLG